MTPEILKINNWNISTNRANGIVAAAVNRCNEYISTLDTSTQELCNQQIENTFLTYVDTWNDTKVPVHPTLKSVNLLDRIITNPLADKMSLGNEVNSKNLLHCAPRSYNTIDQVLNSGNNNDRILFVKGRGGTAGQQVSCIRYSDLGSFTLQPDYIIQEAISDIILYENRKMMFRFFILIHNKQVFLNKFAFAAIHGVEYDKESTSHDVQVNWFTDNVIRIPLHDLEKYNDYIAGLKDLTTSILPVLENVVNNSARDSYILLGADAIPCQDGKVRLIEINIYPNLLKPPVDMLVNMPMFSSMMLKLVTDINDGSWIDIK